MPLSAPSGYTSWLQYAISTMDTHNPHLESCCEESQWGRVVDREEMRLAAYDELQRAVTAQEVNILLRDEASRLRLRIKTLESMLEDVEIQAHTDVVDGWAALPECEWDTIRRLWIAYCKEYHPAKGADR